MKKLIGITGKARAGKDAFAEALIRRGYQRLAFADALKQATALIADEDVGPYHDDIAKEQVIPRFDLTRRAALQSVGSLAREVFGGAVWTSRIIRGWQASGESPAVITDCRFANEAQAIRDAGGIVVRITRPDNVGLTGSAAAHESEQGIPDDLVDVEVTNDGTLGELHHEARKVFDFVAMHSAEQLGMDL